MQLEDQVVSLELCKKLKELNVRQESYFYWCLPKENSNGGLPIYYTIADIQRLEKSFFYPQDKISSFTVAELGEMLPWDITISRNIDKQWHIHFCGDELPQIIAEKSSIMSQDNEADARAMMLIYLIENKLMEIPK